MSRISFGCATRCCCGERRAGVWGCDGALDLRMPLVPLGWLSPPAAFNALIRISTAKTAALRERAKHTPLLCGSTTALVDVSQSVVPVFVSRRYANNCVNRATNGMPNPTPCRTKTRKERFSASERTAGCRPDVQPLMPNSHFAGVVPNNESRKASAGSQIRYSTTLATIGFSMAFANPAACSGIVALKANIRSRNSTSPEVQMSTVRANNRLHG